MKYKAGDILRGKVNGEKFKILDTKPNGYYVYIDIKSGKTYTTNTEMLDNCLLEKVN